MQSTVRYALGWRILHWVMAALVLTTIPIGLTMAARAHANIFDALTNTLYAVHKSIGFTVLLLMILRIGLRAFIGPPTYPDTMPRGLVRTAKSHHYLIYSLLVLTPILGWSGVTAFPALIIAGGVYLPPVLFVPQSEALAERLFAIHGFFALALGVLAIGHVGAAMRHLVIKKDGVFQRMWFGT